jgi:hypothetical protein
MNDPRNIVTLVMPHVTKVLTIAEAALPSEQYPAFRKLVLDEFGRNGLEGELYELFGQHPDQRRG